MEQNEKILSLDLDSEDQQEQVVDVEEESDNLEKESATEERLPPIPNSSLDYLGPESNDSCFYLVFNNLLRAE